MKERNIGDIVFSARGSLNGVIRWGLCSPRSRVSIVQSRTGLSTTHVSVVVTQLVCRRMRRLGKFKGNSQNRAWHQKQSLRLPRLDNAASMPRQCQAKAVQLAYTTFLKMDYPGTNPREIPREKSLEHPRMPI